MNGMDGMGGMGVMMMIGMLLGIVVLLALVALAVLGVISLVRRDNRSEVLDRTTSAEDALRARYAAGELDEEEFERRRSTLRQHSPDESRARR